MRPYDSITVRGVPIKRVKAVGELGDGEGLTFTTRCSLIDKLLNADPMGELTIEVPEHCLA